MELCHIRYFTPVARERSFTRAGAKLHIAQSPLRRQMRASLSERPAHHTKKHGIREQKSRVRPCDPRSRVARSLPVRGRQALSL
ncbi:LysR family transcriptional regulator [Xanthobacter sp. AM33]|uniref:LysR family transcriptional regulator n=1 Tax=Xanthobacter TaxID=279 RepID=UPI0039BFEB7E